MHMKLNQSSGCKSLNGQMIGLYVRLTFLMQYVANADNTFGEGFDWENAPWFDANGLNDVAPMQASTVLEKLQDVG